MRAALTRARTSIPRSMARGNRQLVFVRAGQDPSTAKSVYEFKAELLDGSVQEMSEYKGKVLLIENVATL